MVIDSSAISQTGFWNHLYEYHSVVFSLRWQSIPFLSTFLIIASLGRFAEEFRGVQPLWLLILSLPAPSIHVHSSCDAHTGESLYFNEHFPRTHLACLCKPVYRTICNYGFYNHDVQSSWYFGVTTLWKQDIMDYLWFSIKYFLIL